MNLALGHTGLPVQTVQSVQPVLPAKPGGPAGAWQGPGPYGLWSLATGHVGLGPVGRGMVEVRSLGQRCCDCGLITGFLA